jgi:hypothetical protein
MGWRIAHKAKCFSTGVRLDGFFLCPCRTPDDTKGRKWGRVEGNRDTVCRKARGQFPNNPCGWSNHQAEGRVANPQHDDAH